MYVIVGGGLAGLNYAYRLLQNEPNANVIILEEGFDVAGKLRDVEFEGVMVHAGAGVGRWKKDLRLRQLLTDLGIEVKPYKNTIQYMFPPVDILKVINNLPQPQNNEEKLWPFQKFLEEKTTLATEFINTCGFTDFLRSDVNEAIKNYGFDDLVSGEEFFNVPWNDLILALVTAVGADKIHLNSRVERIDTDFVYTQNGQQYPYGQLILAIPALEVERLLGINTMIRPQPFVRIYAKIIGKEFKELTKKASQTIILAPLRKIIPIDGDVYMIAYADNADAQQLSMLVPLPEADKHLVLENLLKKSLGISELKIVKTLFCLWAWGTHYSLPGIKKPALYPKIILKGESFSKNQGWSEGALE